MIRPMLQSSLITESAQGGTVLSQSEVATGLSTDPVSGLTYAAHAGGPVRMDHLLAAARMEYEKLQRPLPESEIARWK